MAYRIRTQQFCSLSQEQLWQSWLQSVAQELYEELMAHIKKSNSCRSNHLKMTEIYAELEKRKLVELMIEFLRKEYPNTVEEVQKMGEIKPRSSSSTKVSTSRDQDVFVYYKPGLLTFPQKMILENNDPTDLERDVHNFLIGKIGGDYIIIGNRAFIEFFKLKYAKESKEVSMTQREIFQYRLKHGLSPNARSVSSNIEQGEKNVIGT